MTLGRLVSAYVATHVKTALEYRTSLVSQTLAMALNDIMWVTFWAGFFGRFHGLGGWGAREMVMLWAVIAGSFGLAGTVCGNAVKLAGFVARGELDVYLSMPRPVLSHFVLGRMSLPALGDLLFSVGAMIYLQPTVAQWATYLVAVVTAAFIHVCMYLLAGSLAFWVGRGEGLAEQLSNAFVTMTSYPTHIFQGWVKWALFSVFPAGFVAFVPVELLREFRWTWLGALVGYTAVLMLVTRWVFYRGLRRYASGSLLVMRE